MRGWAGSVHGDVSCRTRIPFFPSATYANVLAFGLRLRTATVAEELLDAFMGTGADPSEARGGHSFSCTGSRCEGRGLVRDAGVKLP